MSIEDSHMYMIDLAQGRIFVIKESASLRLKEHCSSNFPLGARSSDPQSFFPFSSQLLVLYRWLFEELFYCWPISLIVILQFQYYSEILLILS